MQPIVNVDDYISYRPLYNDDVPMDKRKAFYVARVIALRPKSESVQVQTYFTNAKPENLLLTGKTIKYRIYTGRAASIQDVKVADVFTVVKLIKSGVLTSASKGDITTRLSRKVIVCTRYWPEMQYDAEVRLLRLLQEEHTWGLLATDAFISYKPLHKHHHLERDDSPMNDRSAFYVAKVLGLEPLDESVRVLTYFTQVEPPYLLSPGKSTEYYHYNGIDSVKNVKVADIFTVFNIPTPGVLGCRGPPDSVVLGEKPKRGIARAIIRNNLAAHGRSQGPLPLREMLTRCR